MFPTVSPPVKILKNLSEDLNIISVDWGPLAGPSPFYFRCAENARLVGRHVAEFLNFLEINFGADVGDFHTVGFSLGAQVMIKISFMVISPINAILF